MDYIPISKNCIANQVLDSREKTADIKGYEINSGSGSPTLLKDILVDGKLDLEFDLSSPEYKQRYYEVPEFSLKSHLFGDRPAYTFSILLELSSPMISPENLCEKLPGIPLVDYKVISPLPVIFSESTCKIA